MDKEAFFKLCDKISELEKNKAIKDNRLDWFNDDIKERQELINKYEIIKPLPLKDNPIIIDDYPYGFRLRTKIKYYMEENNKGTRLISQTLNPKTNEWNKPKASNYDEVSIIVKEKETGHISHLGLSFYDNVSENIPLLKECFDILTERQLEKLKHWIKIMYTNCFITCKVETITNENEERLKQEEEKHKIELAKLYNAIDKTVDKEVIKND